MLFPGRIGHTLSILISYFHKIQFSKGFNSVYANDSQFA